MTVTFAIRAYVRLVCFGHLLLEDWFVAGALAIYLTVAVLMHVLLPGLYNMIHAEAGTYIPGPTFLDDTVYALRLSGVANILTYVGLWLIKASFLVLFYRLGHQIRRYLYVWWVFTVAIVACGAVSIGLSNYDCEFADVNTLTSTCLQNSSVSWTFFTEIATATLDVVSDLLLIVFPVWILARTTLSLRQKIVFSAVFCLVGLTVATTIVRGTFSKIVGQHPAYAAAEAIPWTLWFFVEYTTCEFPLSLPGLRAEAQHHLAIRITEFVTSKLIKRVYNTTAFLVACAISFRSLFVQQRNKFSEAAKMVRQRQSPPTSREEGRTRRYLRRLHMSFLSTAHLLEGTAYGHETWHLPQPASGTMTVDFSRDEGWRPHEEDEESMRALRPHGERNSAAVVTHSIV